MAIAIGLNTRKVHFLYYFAGKEVLWAEDEIVKDAIQEIPIPNFAKFMLKCLEMSDCDRKCIAVGHSK